MAGLSREAWYEEYMLMMDEEYGDYGFRDDPIAIEELALEEEDLSQEPAEQEVHRSYDRTQQHHRAPRGKARLILFLYHKIEQPIAERHDQVEQQYQEEGDRVRAHDSAPLLS